MELSLRHKLEELKDKTWTLARDSLDQGETEVYRSLVDMTERLAGLALKDKSSIAQTGLDVPAACAVGQLPIFARYKNEKYDAELNVDRINGGRGACVRFRGQWQSPSAAAMLITGTRVNGWRFWKSFREDGSVGLIDEFRS